MGSQMRKKLFMVEDSLGNSLGRWRERRGEGPTWEASIDELIDASIWLMEIIWHKRVHSTPRFCTNLQDFEEPVDQLDTQISEKPKIVERVMIRETPLAMHDVEMA